MAVLLSTAYFPPVSWFAAALKDLTLCPDRVIPSKMGIEACEHWQKQSWRNRCMILSSNGPEPLSVPISHNGAHKGDTGRTLITDMLIDWSDPWLIRTERAITSAYRTSAFFDHYRDGLFGILESRPEHLWDLNLRIIEFFFKAFGTPVEITPTTEWIPAGSMPEDLREAIHPKRPDTVLHDLGLERQYFQVFGHKFGFQANLSALDLLFNEGPDSIIYLKKL